MNALAHSYSRKRNKSRPVKPLRAPLRLHANLPSDTLLRHSANAPFLEERPVPVDAIETIEKKSDYTTVVDLQNAAPWSNRTRWTVSLALIAMGSGAILLYNNSPVAPDVLPINSTPNQAAVVPSPPLDRPSIAHNQQPLDEAPPLTERERLELAYEHKLSRLVSENDQLMHELTLSRNETEILKDETLILNKELLQLELELASANEAAMSAVEVKTVYNFVNVPLGSAIPPIESPMPDISTPIQTESVVGAAPNTWGSDSNEQTFDASEGEPLSTLVEELRHAAQEIYGSKDDDAHFDNVSVDDNSVFQNSEYYSDAALTYDPDSGFSLNPEYEQFEEARPLIAPQRIDYPPIANE